MVTSEMMDEMTQGTRPAFVFVCEGLAQHWSQNNKSGILVATNSQAAELFAAKLTANIGKPVSVAEVGAGQELTLADHIARAVILSGKKGVFATDDGQTVYYFEVPPIQTGPSVSTIMLSAC